MPPLEVHHLHATGNRPIQFDILSAMLDTGVVGVLIDLWLCQKGLGWLPFIEFYNADYARLCELLTPPDGALQFQDGGTPLTVADYPAGRSASCTC